MKYLFSLLAILLFNLAVISQNEVVIRIDNPQINEINYIKTHKLEITAFEADQYIDLFVTPESLNELQKENIPFKITQTHEQNKQNLVGNKDISGYRSYDDVLAELQQIAIDYPDICQLTDIGDSRGKIYFNNGLSNYEDYQHDIWLLKISDQVNENEDEPAVYFVGAHHAREPISTEVVMGIIYHLLDSYGVDDEITTMVNESEIYIVPIVNPDGHEVVLDQINTNWRKNIADNNGNGILEYNSYGPDGVDLNRNYGWEWGGSGSSGDQTDETYHGVAAFSEPESQSIKDLLAAHHFTSGISYHSYSELVLWPYAYSMASLAPDHEALEELGTNMANSIPRITGSGHYTPEQSNELYPAAGITDDWAYGKHGVFCYTVELAQQFIPPAYQVEEIVSDNIEAAMMVLNRANHQTLRGHVYDAVSLEPIVAEVFVDGIDGQASARDPYKSNAEFGSYYRLLTNGNKSVTFSAYGYLSQSFDNVAISEDEATILDVYLERAPSGPIFGSVIDGLTGENLEGVEITFLNTPLLPAVTNESGIYEVEEIAYNNYEVKVSKSGYSALLINQEITEENHILNFVLLPSEAISFEEGDFPSEFEFSGNLPWLIDENNSYSGTYSSVSGNISHSQTSSMVLNVEDVTAGEIKFYKKVSSESGWDFLKFYIDNQEQGSWSGEEDWSMASFPINEGSHQLKWSYTKDSNTSTGQDKAWVDDIELPSNAIIMVNAGPDQSICNDAVASLNAFAANYETISWTSSGDGSFSDAGSTASIYTPGPSDIGNGMVTLEVTAEGELGIASDEMILYLETCLNIDEYEAATFSMSPNPAKDNILFQFQSNELKELNIFHVSGQLIKSIQLNPNQIDLQLNAHHFRPGVYIVKLVQQSGSSSQRLIIE